MSEENKSNPYEILNTGAGKKILNNLKLKIQLEQDKAFKSKDAHTAFTHITKANTLKEIYDEFYYNSNA